MWFRLVADAAMVVHFGFLAYLVVGGFVAWKWPPTIWAHAGVALYALFNVIVGWPCPLTDLENWGRARAGESALAGTGFIDHYVAGVVYPRDHETLAQVLVAVVVLGSWAGIVIRRRQAPRR
ncbi:MAG: DUF2784 domain-containing protein [Phycicoccus sp.]